MIVGIGVDVVEVSRFRAQLERSPALLERLFVPAERGLATRSLAARFAAKEAVAKALGAPAGMTWQDCEVLRAQDGCPSVELRGTVGVGALRGGAQRWHLSISHDGDLATAMVVAEKD